MTDISIHALLAESDNSAYGALDGASISIHALLAESDKCYFVILLAVLLFLSTLSLRRATSVFFIIFNASCTFLSTLSLRRATMAFYMDCLKSTYFYPRSPCGERL